MATPATIWRLWPLDGWLISGLLLAGWLYGRVVISLRRRTTNGRLTTTGQIIAFYSGLTVLALALMSPLEPLSALLFSAHMGQHLLLLLVAAPLLVMGTPTAVLGWLIPWPNTRRTLAQWWQRHPRLHHLDRPWAAWLAYGLTLWLWHLPVLYEAALRLRWVHYVEHALFLSTAVCFWWVLLRQTTSRYGLGLFLVFTTALHGGLLAVLLTFAPRPWYPIHATTAAVWGLTPLEDQQLAGALMWVPSSLIYVAAAVYLLSSWLKQLEQRDHRRSRYAE